MIASKCPHCQAGIRGEDRFAGRVVACPKCKKLVQMPAVAQAVPAKAVLADSAPEVVSSTGSQHKPPPLVRATTSELESEHRATDSVLLTPRSRSENSPVKLTGYVAASLQPDEDVVYQTRLHRFFFVGPVIIVFIFLMVGSLFIATMWLGDVPPIFVIMGPFLYLVTSVLVVEKLATFFSSEFAVTTKRVILKTGFVRRTTLELFLNKIDAVSVDQSIFGRLFDYGTIRVSAATEKQSFKFIMAPLQLRKEIQARQTS